MLLQVLLNTEEIVCCTPYNLPYKMRLSIKSMCSYNAYRATKISSQHRNLNANFRKGIKFQFKVHRKREREKSAANGL